MLITERSASGTSIVTDEMRKQFREDGVVVLRGLLEPTWLQMIDQGVLRNVKNPGPYQVRYYEGTDREFLMDMCNWFTIPEFRMLCSDSPLVDVIADLLDTQELRMFYDQIFVRDGSGGEKRMPWHQDTTWWVTAGMQICAVWMTNSVIPRDQALEFVRGSHLGPKYAGTMFDPANEVTPYYTGLTYDPLPDVQADREGFDIVAFDTEPGDAIVFHPQILHGGGASEGPRQTLSIRMYGDDVTYAGHPGEPQPPNPGLAATAKLGQPLRSTWFPQIYPRRPFV